MTKPAAGARLGALAAIHGRLAPALVAAYRLFAFHNEKARGYFELRRDLEARLERETRPAGPPWVQVHVASVGEALQAMPLLAALRAEGRFRLALTYTSASLYKNMPKGVAAELVLPAPIDAPGPVRRFLDLLRPELVVFSSYDLWPAFTWEAVRRGIPLALVNAALPAVSGRLQFPARLFYRRLYAGLATVGAVTAEDAERFAALGLAGRARVTGNCRFDQTLDRCRAVADDDPELAAIPAGGEVLVAGSVWPADLRHLLPALERLLARHSRLRAVLAPHEPSEKHLAEIEEFCARAGIPTARYSRLRSGAPPGRVTVVDGLGVLYKIYQRGTMAYVGGSFQQGVHSVMEPAGMGLPVVIGPVHRNSAEALQMVRTGGAVAAADAAGIEAALERWLADPAARAAAGGLALRVVEGNAGATGRTLELIRGLLPQTETGG